MASGISSQFRIPLTGRSALFRYAMAVLVTALATGVRWILDPSLGYVLSPFPFYYLAVTFAAWYGGYGPGVLAMVLSALGSAFLFFEPMYSFAAMDSRDAGSVLIFSAVSLVICHLTENLHRSLRRHDEMAHELLTSQRRITSILENVQGCFFNVDSNGRFTHANENCKDYLRFTREELIGKALWETFPEWSRTEFASQFDKLLREKKPVAFEFFDPKAGKWYQAYFSPSSDGTSVHLYEISDRKRQQVEYAVTQVLAEDPPLHTVFSRILQTLCENTRWEIGGFWRVDPAGKYLQCREVWAANPPRAMEFIEMSRKVTFSRGEGLPGRVWASSEPVIVKELSKEPQTLRAPVATKEGLKSAVAFPIMLGKEFMGVLEFFSHEILAPDPALLKMFQTLGSEIGQFIEKKEAEEALKLSRQQLALALQTAKMGYWSWDLKTGDMKWSEDLSFFHGMAPEEFPGTLETFLESIHREDRELVRTTILEAVEAKKDFNLEFRTIWPDQSVHWFDARGQVVYDEEGNPSRMIGLGIDITARKAVELQLIMTNEDLERGVIKRTAELAEANRILEAEIAERKNVEKEILEISQKEQRRFGLHLHDSLCQELAGILMMSQVLFKKLEKKEIPEAQDLEKINQLLNQGISQARDLARGLYPVDLVSDSLMVALRELAHRTESLYSLPCLFICPRPIFITDHNAATHLYRIAQEAITNAAKHGEAKLIQLKLLEEENYITLILEDDGKGRLDDLRSHPGIGLHIMKYRARMLNASLKIEDLLPSGTRLTLSFKVSEEDRKNSGGVLNEKSVAS